MAFGSPGDGSPPDGVVFKNPVGTRLWQVPQVGFLEAWSERGAGTARNPRSRRDVTVRI